jgi:ACR3 family arsenite efflux pump ArsB
METIIKKLGRIYEVVGGIILGIIIVGLILNFIIVPILGFMFGWFISLSKPVIIAISIGIGIIIATSKERV